MRKAALFDMDGLLFDTERMFATLANAVAQTLGFCFTPRMITDTLGVNESMCNAYFAARIPAYRAETFWPAYHAAADAYVAQHGAPQKPHLADTLHTLRAAGVRMAVVSASPQADILRNLRSAGIAQLFDALVSGDMGLPGKPAPDMYLRGAAAARGYCRLRRAGGFAKRSARRAQRGRLHHHDSRSDALQRCAGRCMRLRVRHAA